MNLLIDLGNSRLKWGLGQGRDIWKGEPIALDHESFSEWLLSTWSKIDIPDQIAFSSVSSTNLSEEICQVAKQLWPSIEIIMAKTRAQACGVQNAYQCPSQLGVDRWLCLLALRHHHPLPACVMDCGTAITVDMLDARGIHLGGLITPGLTLMKKSLYQGTQQLQFSEHHYSAGLADCTEAGIYSGTLFSAVGLIEYVLANQAENFQLILTGGDAELLAEYIVQDLIIEPDLVLQGLSVYLEYEDS